LLRDVLASCGYCIAERVLCPTEIGVSNRRRRFYLVASQEQLLPWRLQLIQPCPPAVYLDRDPPAEAFMPPAVVLRFWKGIDIVCPDEKDAVTCCFTSAYGHSPVQTGSFLVTQHGIRRFTPAEIARILGFPPHYRLPARLSLRRAWSLVGNSLSVHAVRAVLSAIPELHDLQQTEMPLASGG
jgi:site-specific DNA-cytosine methylase